MVAPSSNLGDSHYFDNNEIENRKLRALEKIAENLARIEQSLWLLTDAVTIHVDGLNEVVVAEQSLSS